MCLGRTDLSASRPAWSRPARPPRRAPPRPDAPVVRMSGFWIRQVLFEDGENISIFRIRKTKNVCIFHFFGRRNEEPLPTSTFSIGRTKKPSPLPSSSDPLPSTHGQQLFSAILRFGSPDRSSTVKIGPKIEIGPLLRPAKHSPL